MVEPTETESKDDLDAFVAALRAVVAEARTDPERLKTAPHTMPVGRLDEVAAARNPVVRQRFADDDEPAARRGPRRDGGDGTQAARAAASETRAAQATATGTLVAAGPAACLVELPLLRASGDRADGASTSGSWLAGRPHQARRTRRPRRAHRTRRPRRARGACRCRARSPSALPVEPAGGLARQVSGAFRRRSQRPGGRRSRRRAPAQRRPARAARRGLRVVVRRGLAGRHAAVRHAGAYRLVRDAMAGALSDVGVAPDDARDEPYTRSPLCFASALRHDLLVAGTKAVAVAQCQRGGRCLVHGSVLERRPPATLVAAVEAAIGQPWQGDGLAGGGIVPDGASAVGGVRRSPRQGPSRRRPGGRSSRATAPPRALPTAAHGRSTQ